MKKRESSYSNKIRALILIVAFIIILAVIIFTLFKINSDKHNENKSDTKNNSIAKVNKASESIETTSTTISEVDKIQQILGENVSSPTETAIKEDDQLPKINTTEEPQKNNKSFNQKGFDDENEKIDETEIGKSYSGIKNRILNEQENKTKENNAANISNNITEKESITTPITKKKQFQKKPKKGIKYDKEVKDISDSAIMIVDKTGNNKIKPKISIEVDSTVEVEIEEDYKNIVKNKIPKSENEFNKEANNETTYEDF